MARVDEANGLLRVTCQIDNVLYRANLDPTKDQKKLYIRSTDRTLKKTFL